VCSPDGRRIVTASDDKTARIWDAASGKPIGGPLKGHEAAVISATFSPDGARIVTGSRDQTARIWDAASGKAIGEPLNGHENWVNSAAFNRDGARIVTASQDRTARVWDIFPSTQALVSAAKASVARCLTQEQRTAFFLPPEPPAWCIEMEKWPYDAPEWKQWLSDIRAGKTHASRGRTALAAGSANVAAIMILRIVDWVCANANWPATSVAAPATIPIEAPPLRRRDRLRGWGARGRPTRPPGKGAAKGGGEGGKSQTGKSQITQLTG